MRYTVKDLEEYFRTHKFKREKLVIRKGAVIIDRRKYFESNLATIKSHKKTETFLPYYDRLIEFIRIVENE